MADALSATNQPVTRNNRTARRRTMYVAPAAVRRATEETTSPSPSFSSSNTDIPTDSQLQIMESLLCVDTTTVKPSPVRHQRFTRVAPAIKVATATDLIQVPVPTLQSRLKYNLDACAQAVSADVTAQESATSGAFGAESAIFNTASFTGAVEEKDEASTASSDIDIPSDSQLQLIENLLCGSDQAVGFSDSGIALIGPGVSETMDVGLFPVSSSNILVSTDSQMQLMEDMLCGNEMMARPDPPTDHSKRDNVYEQDGEAAGTSSSRLCAPEEIGIHLLSR